MVTKKTNKSKKKAKIIHHRKPKKDFGGNKTGLIILIIAIVVILGIYYFPFSTENEPIGDDPVLAVINGEELLQSELDMNWNAIPLQAKTTYSKDQLLEELIEQKLLMQKANELNLTLDDNEVDSYIQMQLMTAGMNESQFDEILKAQGSSLDNLKNIYTQQLLIAKLFESEISIDLNISDEEVEEYYNDNQEKFFQSEQVTVKHILLMISEQFSEEEAMNLSKEVVAKLDNGADFCDMVENYSMDLASVENCGEYTFGAGVMVPEFEEAAFEMENDEIRTVKSEYGYHIILKISSEDAKNLTLNDKLDGNYENMTVAEIVKQLLTEQKASEIYTSYISKIKENATIEMKNTIKTDVVVEDSETDRAADLEMFAKCIADSGAKMYGAHWCSHCNAQKEMFGDAKSFVPYVECDENGDNANVQECIDNNIEGFPTWIIDGEMYMGEQSLEKLASLTGCNL